MWVFLNEKQERNFTGFDDKNTIHDGGSILFNYSVSTYLSTLYWDTTKLYFMTEKVKHVIVHPLKGYIKIYLVCFNNLSKLNFCAKIYSCS